MEEKSELIFPSSWKTIRLGDLGKIGGGGTPSTKTERFWGGGLAWLVPSEISRSTALYMSETERTITQAAFDETSIRLYPPGTVMMTSRATIGEVAINAVPMATNQGFINIECDIDLVLNEFLAYWISHNKKAFISRANGVTFKEISKSAFKLMTIALPSLEEQKAITAVLRTVQEAIATRRREAALERERKAALMQRLFTCGTRGERLKDTAVGRIPESWEVFPLDRAYKITKKPKSLRYANFEQIPFVPMELIPAEQPYFEDFVYKSSETLTSGTYFEPGDVLLAKITPSFENGKQGIIEDLPIPFGIATTEVIPIQAVKNLSHKLFIFYYLLLPVIRGSLAAKMEGTTGRQRLKPAMVRELAVPLPEISEQLEIVGILQACDAKIAALEKESALLNELFQALLEELMSGRLRVANISMVEP